MTEEYYAAVGEVLIQVTSGSVQRTGEETIQSVVKDWATCFPASLIDHVANPKAKPLIARLLDTYSREEKCLNAVATVVHGRKIEDWVDTDLAEFEQAMRSIIADIEDIALHPTEGLELTEESARGIAQLVERRIERLMGSLERLVGPEASREALASLLSEEEVGHS